MAMERQNPSSALTKTDPRQKALKALLNTDGVKAALRAVLPKLAEQVGTTADRIIGAALVACAKNPTLLSCSPDSTLRALLECAQLGLCPGGITGEAYLIPYSGECTLQIGVRGFQRLAFDAGRVTKIEGRVVYEGDEFDIAFEPRYLLTHKPKLDVPAGTRIVAAYAKFSFRDAEPQYELLRLRDLDAIRAQADAKKPSPAWKSWYDQMAIKSAIKRGAKRLDLSPTSPLARAVRLDNAAEGGESQRDLLGAIELPEVQGQLETVPEDVQEEARRAAEEERRREEQELVAEEGRRGREGLGVKTEKPEAKK